jgi:hypothetical protein
MTSANSFSKVVAYDTYFDASADQDVTIERWLSACFATQAEKPLFRAATRRK